jgi:2-C-methyl-D-erythritol 4-phosphate cytidylyltransferase
MHAAELQHLFGAVGVPLLVHTLRRFEQCDAIDEVILVLQPSMTADVLALISRHNLRKIARVVGGGAERQDSVYRAIQVIKEEVADVIAVHDAVRPFVRPEEIRSVVERAQKTGAALMAMAAIETIKQVKSGRVQRTLDRRRIFHAQTPQAFRYSIIREAYERAYADGFSATDDSQLVERIGHRVSVVEGSPINIKITRPFDFRLAEVIKAEFFD